MLRLAALVLATAPILVAPPTARIGATVTAKASGLKPGAYALTLVWDKSPGLHGACVARLATARAVAGHVRLSGRIPRKLTCWENDSVRLGVVGTAPGPYHLIVAVPDGPSGFDVRYSFVRRAIRITR